METKVINDITSSKFVIKQGYPRRTILKKYVKFGESFSIRIDQASTYREYELEVGGRVILLSFDDLVEAAEITVYETLNEQTIEHRISKIRGVLEQPYLSDKIQEFAAFDAARKDVRKDASSRIEMIGTSSARLEELLKSVKICPAQCKNLVQTGLEGIEKMKSTYFVVSKNDSNMWQLYYSEKLRHLISSLDRLVSTLETIEDLLQVCGSQWWRMGLVLSAIPLPSPEKKTFTKFDLLLKELSWNLDTIYYILDFAKDVKLNWNEGQCRVVLERNDGTEGAAAVGMRPVESGTLVREDRADLLFQLKNGSIPSKKNALQWILNFILFITGNNRLRDSFAPTGFRGSFPADELYFAEALESRLKESGETSESNESSAVPFCFRIDHLHLEFISRLSAGDLESGRKAIYRGKWRGQEVAIGITSDLDFDIRQIEEEIEKEATVVLTVQHPNIVDCFGYAFTGNAPPPVSCKGDATPMLASYLVMELMQGDLRQEINRLLRIQSGNPFPDAVTIDILLQIVGAMSHMHDCGVIYRDLKADNCVVSQRSSSKSSLKFYTVKLIDFDTAKMLDPNAIISDHTIKRGTTRWIAPEVWGTGKPGEMLTPYTNSADVWSFGMTCYEVITGLRPFHECKYDRDLMLALHERRRPKLPPSVSCPEGLKELMSNCWAQDPKERPTFKNIEKALWMIKKNEFDVGVAQT